VETSQDSFHKRILISALLIGAFIVGISLYQAYSDDLKEQFNEKMVELLPDLDHSLAQL